MEKRIAKNMLSNIKLAMQEDNVSARFLSVIEGPQVITFSFQLPIGTKQQSLLKSAAFRSSLTVALNRNVSVKITSNGLKIEVSKLPGEILTPHVKSILPYTHKMKLCMGVNTTRNPVWADIDKVGHVLLIGPTGRGKTESAKSYLWMLAENMAHYKLKFVIVARKARVWQSFDKNTHLLGGHIITQEDEIRSSITYIHDLMNRRSYDENSSNLPIIILMLDDLINLSTVVPYKMLEEIASMGLAVNIFLWVSTQTDGKNGGLTQPLSANMRCRLVFGGTNAGDASRFAGRGQIGADLVGKSAGDALLVIDGIPQRIVTPYAGDIAEFLPKYEKNLPIAPWNQGQGGGEWGRADSVKPDIPPPFLDGSIGSSSSMSSCPHIERLPMPIHMFDPENKTHVNMVKDVYLWTGITGKPSITKTTNIVFGFKNGKSFSLVKRIVNTIPSQKRKTWTDISEVQYHFS